MDKGCWLLQICIDCHGASYQQAYCTNAVQRIVASFEFEARTLNIRHVPTISTGWKRKNCRIVRLS